MPFPASRAFPVTRSERTRATNTINRRNYARIIQGCTVVLYPGWVILRRK